MALFGSRLGLAAVLIIGTLSGLDLAGCATAYQPKSFSGGFSETQVGENSFDVYFRGNGQTHEERAEDFTLLRSAEVTLAHGYQFFIIVDSRAGATQSLVTTPATTTTTVSSTPVGGVLYGTAHTTTTGGQSYLIQQPSVRNTIVCFKDRPAVQGLVYEAQFVARSVRAKYGMPTEGI